MLKKISFLLFIYFLPAAVSGQSIDSLKTLIKAIQKGETDFIRFAANEKFLAGMEQLLREPNSFSRNFDSLKNVSVLTSEDEKLRLYSWAVPRYNGDKYEYFGFLQYRKITGDTLIRLIDSTENIKKPESEKLTAAKWLGAVYYKIIDVKKRKAVYYTLLGWKAKDQKQTQKIIEILQIDKDVPRFGLPLIKSGSVFKNRMVFTFNANVSMTLNFNKSFNGIVFDHLGTNKNNITQLLGPDGTYDGLKFKKGRWVLYRDIDVRTHWEPKEIPRETPDELKENQKH